MNPPPGVIEDPARMATAHLDADENPPVESPHPRQQQGTEEMPGVLDSSLHRKEKSSTQPGARTEHNQSSNTKKKI